MGINIMATVGEVKYAMSAFGRGSMGWPTCAKCDKPVDWMAMKPSPTKFVAVVTVWCHGAHEQIEIPADMFDHSRVRFDGKAFEEKPVFALNA